jgi:C-terminal processing protease CtpA/Prc
MAKRKASVGRVKKSAPPATASVHGAEPYKPTMSSGAMRSAVNKHVGRRLTLAAYRSKIAAFTPRQRELVIGQALRMLEQVYAHLPLKRSLHANDPTQSLRLLRLRHAGLDERAFQSAMLEIFLGLRDLHTNYILPSWYARKVAFLPFRIEEFYVPGGLRKAGVNQQRRFVVSWVSPLNTVKTLKKGMVVSHWNGSPIELAVARNGDREAGSNADARRAQGIEALTLRWLGMSLPPGEDWVNLTYTDGVKVHESRFDWEVFDRNSVLAEVATSSRSAPEIEIGLDLKRLFLDRARKLVFDPQAIKVEHEMTAHVKKKAAVAARALRWAHTSHFPEAFPAFGTVTTPSGEYGYIRLKSFLKKPDHVSGAVLEFRRILKTLPQSGLILDVRGNGGGRIAFGERILQMLTPRQITPEPFYFRATPLTLEIVSEPGSKYGDWKKPIGQGLESGADFSQGFPVTNLTECNEIGQVYQGPVVLITDALCYSTTDMFAAGFQDHHIGTILGCHDRTGAGGANVWEYNELQKATEKSENPFPNLPGKASMRVAARSCARVGRQAGRPIEDYGVEADKRYFMTKNDVVGHNADLIATAAKMLKSRPKHMLQVSADPAAPSHKFSINCSNVDRIDLFVNDRPALSLEVSGSQTRLPVKLPRPAPAGSVRANGYRKGMLVVSARDERGLEQKVRGKPQGLGRSRAPTRRPSRSKR